MPKTDPNKTGRATIEELAAGSQLLEEQIQREDLPEFFKKISALINTLVQTRRSPVGLAAELLGMGGMETLASLTLIGEDDADVRRTAGVFVLGAVAAGWKPPDE